MKHQYRIFALALTIALSLTACGSEESAAASAAVTQEVISAQAETATEPETAEPEAVETEATEAASDGETSEQEEVNAASDHSNILIVYFAVAENSDVDAVSSASVVTIDGVAKGRIQALAEMIQAETGGDLFPIQTSVQYPVDGEKLVDYAEEEQDQNARPEITNHIENLSDYDTIFIGYPIWWYDIPQILYTFFDEYDLSGKTIIPFSSHNGSRLSGTVDTIKALEPGATVVEDAFTVSEKNVANAQEDIAEWLQRLG